MCFRVCKGAYAVLAPACRFCDLEMLLAMLKNGYDGIESFVHVLFSEYQRARMHV